MIAGKKILISISGGIAAYKIPLLVRLLVKRGAEVKILMTPAAESFVSALTLSTLSKNEVGTGLFHQNTWANHVMLGRWADVMLIAPLTCNTLAKMAAGLCDNLVLATYLSATCPVVVAPAMDEDMWHHASTKANLKKIEAHGCNVLDVGFGELASGLTGEGRMAEPEAMAEALEAMLTPNKPLKGKKVLVTAGPTYEPIDPVRFISNHSSGKMGYALAETFYAMGADVVLVSGPVHLPPPKPGIQLQKVATAGQMYEVCLEHKNCDVAVMAAAVADYSPATPLPQKMKKAEATMELQLRKTVDILAALGKEKTPGQLLVGFALETNNELENAQKKLQAKNADLIVLNSLQDAGAGFGHDTNKATFIFKNNKYRQLPLQSKKQLATEIAHAIIELL